APPAAAILEALSRHKAEVVALLRASRGENKPGAPQSNESDVPARLPRPRPAVAGSVMFQYSPDLPDPPPHGRVKSPPITPDLPQAICTPNLPEDMPPYARRSKSLEVLIPILYLKGISTGDFAEALSALLGANAGGLSASTIVRLKEV